MPLRLSKHRVLLDGIPLNESKASDLPSASTPDIWSVTGNTVPLSGTATITGFTPAPQAGAKRTLLCTGTPSFTHSTNLLLPGSANYTATTGDRIEVLAVTTTQFRLSLLQTSVLHFATKSLFPATGVGSTLYLDKSTGLIWRWDTGTSSYVGAPFPIDADGNLVANIAHRTGLLATLLTEAGLDGEISVATDYPVLIRHNGVANEAVVYGKTRAIGEIRTRQKTGSVIGNGSTSVVLKGGQTQTEGGIAYDSATGEYVFPPTLTTEVEASLEFYLASSQSLLGTYRKLVCELFLTSISAWTPAASYLFPPTPLVSGDENRRMARFRSVPGGAFSKLRFSFVHDAGAGVTVAASLDAVVRFIK